MPAPSGRSDNLISGQWDITYEENTEKNDVIKVRNLEVTRKTIAKCC